MIEQTMDRIAEGTLDKDQAARETLGEAIPIYDKLQVMQETWLEKMKVAMEEHKGLREVELQDANTRV